MRKYLAMVLLFVVVVGTGQAQKYKLEKGVVDFYSYAPLEDIEAKNSSPVGIIDSESNAFSLRLKIKEFIFPSELMQEHFNENYMESDKFPTSTFKGVINGEYNFKKDGEYKVMAEGKLTIHGLTREVMIPVTINVSKKYINFSSQFKVSLEDYDIEVPELVFQKIAEVIDVSIKSELVNL